METKGSWLYMLISLLIVRMLCFHRANPLSLQGREPN